VRLHGLITQRAVILTDLAVRTWNLNVLCYVRQSMCDWLGEDVRGIPFTRTAVSLFGVSASATSWKPVISPGRPVTRTFRKHQQDPKLQTIHGDGAFVLHIFWIRNCGNDHIYHIGHAELRCLTFHEYFFLRVVFGGGGREVQVAPKGDIGDD